MPQPVPTHVVHFTRVEHLGSMIQHGLLSDSASRAMGATQVEIGHPSIKARRRERTVPLDPGGVVGDYVPFYFAPRSPMLYVIDKGHVPGYADGCDRIVYLLTTLEQLRVTGHTLMVTDRNAALQHAAFLGDRPALGDFVDWQLMREREWYDTPEQPDRKERRMAEALVHDGVAWGAILEVAARSTAIADEVRRTLQFHGEATPVSVRPDWYF